MYIKKPVGAPSASDFYYKLEYPTTSGERRLTANRVAAGMIRAAGKAIRPNASANLQKTQHLH